MFRIRRIACTETADKIVDGLIENILDVPSVIFDIERQYVIK